MSANEGVTHELKQDLVCGGIVLRRRCQPDDGIVEHYPHEESEEYPAQWADLPSGIHASSLGMSIKFACTSLRRGVQHQGQ